MMKAAVLRLRCELNRRLIDETGRPESRTLGGQKQRGGIVAKYGLETTARRVQHSVKSPRVSTLHVRVTFRVAWSRQYGLNLANFS